MLASAIKQEALEKLKYPLLASPKLDGIRAILRDGIPLTRSLKPIPNRYIQYILGTFSSEIEGVDGELTIGNISGKHVYNETVSGVMSEEGEPEFKYNLFDVFDAPDLPYTERYRLLNQRVSRLREKQPVSSGFISILGNQTISNSTELNSYEQRMIESGFEGIMIRDLSSPYKYGRSTPKEGYLSKIKRFKDAEAKIIGFEEKLSNMNEAKINERGLSERSSHKENMIPANTLGALIVEVLNKKLFHISTFNIGSGFDDELRKHIWENKEAFMNKTIVFKYQPSGVLDRPRFPIYKGLRSELDLSDV